MILKISDEEFLRRTPHELNLLHASYITNLEVEDYRFAHLCSVFANIHRNAKKQKPYKPEDFKLNRRGKAGVAKEAEQRKQTWQQQLSHLKAVTVAFGGFMHPKHGKLTKQEALAALTKQ